MIRFINCVRRRKDISVEEFRRYWNRPEFEYQFERLFIIVQPRKFAKNLTLQVSANEQIRQERGSGEPFDGTLEYWWQDARNYWKNTMPRKHKRYVRKCSNIKSSL